MPQLVTDYRTSYIRMTQEQFFSLPEPVQQLLQVYGEEIPQGFGKPSIIRIATYRIEELSAAYKKALGLRED